MEGSEPLLRSRAVRKQSPSVLVEKALGNIRGCERTQVPVRQQGAQRGGHLVQQQEGHGGEAILWLPHARDGEECQSIIVALSLGRVSCAASQEEILHRNKHVARL